VVSFETPREAREIGPSSVAKVCLKTADEIWLFARVIDPR
jgi:hypothetical protein